jgi:hypothetical protein
LGNFLAIWYICCGYLVHFSPFWNVVPRKIWQLFAHAAACMHADSADAHETMILLSLQHRNLSTRASMFALVLKILFWKRTPFKKLADLNPT